MTSGERSLMPLSGINVAQETLLPRLCGRAWELDCTVHQNLQSVPLGHASHQQLSLTHQLFGHGMIQSQEEIILVGNLS